MLFRNVDLEGIKRGTISVAFRRWKRPTVKAGGTLLTPIGQLAIQSVAPIEPSQITKADSIAAGYEDRASLLAELESRTDGQVYRIDLGTLAPDPRIALRARSLGEQAAEHVANQLERMDSRSPTGPWTTDTLRIIHEHPGTRALDLAQLLGQEKDPFKVNVRKLKKLGLTESLDTGYRLSPRGRDLLRRLTDH